MHNFDELVYRGSEYTLSSLEKLSSETRKTLETSAPTSSIKNLQMIELQKVILAVGMFSLLDGILQDGFKCNNGFKKLKEILIDSGSHDICDRFIIFESAINVLKHGKGRSYNYLVSRYDALPFKIKKPDEFFFSEGNVSEVNTLIEVNDQFVLDCAGLIGLILKKIRELDREFYI